MTGKRDKREAILEAMLDLIVERGFHDAPMSVLAKRSGASPGVIYHYFPSKDDLIHAVY
jgi:AcrR family transcriptional regulator